MLGVSDGWGQRSNSGDPARIKVKPRSPPPTCYHHPCLRFGHLIWFVCSKRSATVPQASGPSPFGTYNTLLCNLFPIDHASFGVCPRRVTVPDESPDCILMLDVLFKHKPVLGAGVKYPDHFQSPSAREAADKHIQSRINDLAGWLRSPYSLLSVINRV